MILYRDHHLDPPAEHRCRPPRRTCEACKEPYCDRCCHSMVKNWGICAACERHGVFRCEGPGCEAIIHPDDYLKAVWPEVRALGFCPTCEEASR